MEQAERILNIENQNISNVFGEFDANIKKIEQAFSVHIVNRGEDVKITGEESKTARAFQVLQSLNALAQKGEQITTQNLNYLISSLEEEDLKEVEKLSDGFICITANGRPVKPKTLGQKNM